MKRKRSSATSGSDLRVRAEKFLAAQGADLVQAPMEDVQELVHELHVQQIELEMQNEELRRVQKQLEESRAKYTELYDFAPVGYFTFDRQGLIVDVNLTGATALGVEKHSLINCPFSTFIKPGFQSTFYSHLQQVFSGRSKQQCQLHFVPQGRAPFPASLESMAVRNRQGDDLCRTVLIDISGCMAVEAHLSQQLRFLQQLIDVIPQPIFYKDANGFYQGCNKTFEEYYGVSKDHIIGKTVYDIAPSELADTYHQKDTELFHHPGAQIYEFQVRKPDGNNREVIFHKATYLNTDGAVGGLVGVIQDITERKAAEAALRESEELYRSLFENMLNGLAYCKMLFEQNQPQDFIYLSVNSAFEALTGLKNVAGKKVSEVIPGIRESDPELFEIYGRVALTGKPERFETYVEALQMWFSISVYSPEKEYFVAVFDVITARKRTEKKLRRSEDRYRSLVENILDGLVIFRLPGGRFLYLNQQICKIYGYNRQQGLRLSFRDLIIPEEQGRFQNWVQDQLQGQDHPGAPQVFTARRRDGSTFLVEVAVAPVTFQEKPAVQGIIRDVSDREHLRQQVHYAQRMQALGTMAAGIAHEIRTPLTVCSSAAQFILEDDLAPEFRRQCLEKMLEGIAKASAIIENLLKFTRPPEKVEITRMDLGAVIDDTLALSANQARRQNVELRRDGPVASIYLDGLPGLLPQAFLSLLLNALNAMPDGGILTVCLEATDQEAVITITDTGHGIAPADLPYIFDPFFTTAATREGIGLGLSICHTIIRKHLGSIEVESTLGQGARFTVRLPVGH